MFDAGFHMGKALQRGGQHDVHTATCFFVCQRCAWIPRAQTDVVLHNVTSLGQSLQWKLYATKAVHDAVAQQVKEDNCRSVAYWDSLNRVGVVPSGWNIQAALPKSERR